MRTFFCSNENKFYTFLDQSPLYFIETKTKHTMAQAKNTFDRNDVYVKLTDSFINLLNMGIIPWERPWTPQNAPANLISKKSYRGSNVWLLNAVQEIRGYKSRFWVTFKQAQDLGGNVRKGEKSQMIVFWQFKKFSKEVNGKNEEKTIPFLKFSNVFNVEQCENIPADKIPAPVENEIGSIEELDKVFENWTTKPEVIFGGDRASYIPAIDKVKMPQKETFKDTESFYKTLSHEYGHSTGANNRLGREAVVNFDHFGSHQYAKEELVAEMFASFMLGVAGLEAETHKNSEAYIQNWVAKLKNDPKMIMEASKDAQKAVEYVLNGGNVESQKEEKEEVMEEETV